MNLHRPRHRSSPNGRAQRAFRRLLSPRVIITKVNAIIRRLFHKTERAPMHDILETLEEWDLVAGETEHVQTSHHEETREERVQGEGGGLALIESLPSEVLIEIFDCHRLLAKTSGPSWIPWEWHRLAHVCSRWRSIIFEKTLDFWPALPIAIRYPRSSRFRHVTSQDEDNIIAALKHPDRICELNVPMTKSLLRKSALLLQASFPTLECLRTGSQDTDATGPLILPVGFLGGSTPRLRDVHLTNTAFSALPLLIQSARALVSLQLDNIPNSGYFSPEALAAGLSATPRLKLLKVYFQAPSFRPEQRRTSSPPKTRSSLPALTEIHFRGNSDYFEDLVSRIDAPAVEQVDVNFIELNTFDTPQLAQFINRTKTLKSPHHTSIRLSDDDITIIHDFRIPSPSVSGTIQLKVSCDDVDRQMSILVHVGRQFSRLLPSVETVNADGSPSLFSLRDQRETDSAKWLEILRHFRGVRKLEVSGALVPNIASALEQVTGNMARGILPFLRDLHLHGSESSMSPSIEPFVAARQPSSHPVSVHYSRDDSFDNLSDND
ncbi:hypothetical protein EDB92DRAFT_584403 [Lactarius akahatsu]|uniref:F-box domain-containing protein n=2 Tax=Lactarius akahatsu TaxID=416441 RepID=A0AAD4Q510_9AGAM|nr:hypothetical protein EDB92DRAFT_584403 [Lactarius akahatsu]